MTNRKLLSREPTEEMWGGLARDIMLWMDMHDGSSKTPRNLFLHLARLGTHIPAWLTAEPEMKNLDHVPSKGTRCVIIYRAMFDAAPAAEPSPPGAGAPTEATEIPEEPEFIRTLRAQLEEGCAGMTRLPPSVQKQVAAITYIDLLRAALCRQGGRLKYHEQERENLTLAAQNNLDRALAAERQRDEHIADKHRILREYEEARNLERDRALAAEARVRELEQELKQ